METPPETTTNHASDVEKSGVVTKGPGSEPAANKIAQKILKHSHDADAAMKAYEGIEGQAVELTEEANKRLLRKIDWHLMPVRIPR